MTQQTSKVGAGPSAVGRFLRRLVPRRPESIAVITLLLVGIPFSIAIPIGAGTDEETHVIRAWDMAGLFLIPNEVSRNERPFPSIYWNESYRRQLLLRPLPPGYFAEHGDLPVGAEGYIYDELPTRSVYSPPLLLPQAMAFRYLAHKWHLSAMVVYIGARMAGLLAYAFLVWAAVRLTPLGKWTMVAVALLPTSVFQATTIGADPISVGLALVFVAGTLKVAQRERIGWPQFAALAGLAGMLFLAKVNMAILAVLPFLVIPRSRFATRGGYFLLGGAYLILGIAEVGGWAAVAFPRLETVPSEANPVSQALFVAGHPGAFLLAVGRDLAANGLIYLQTIIAHYGYFYGQVPAPVFPLVVAGITCAVLLDGRGTTPPSRVRRGLLAVAILGVVGTMLSLYLSFTPVGAERIEGLQGRYYTPFVLLVLLALVGLWRLPEGRSLSRWAVGFLLAGLVVFGIGIWLTYYVPCGKAFTQPGLCYLPQYKNWAPTASYSKSIDGEFQLTQEIVPECSGATQLGVWLESTAADPDAHTMFVLRDPNDDRDLAHLSVRNRDLPEEGWLNLDFAPDWESEGSLYLLTIRPTDQTGGRGPRIAYSLKPEYPEGKLFEDGKEVGVDVVFRYGCVAGWRRLLLGPEMETSDNG